MDTQDAGGGDEEQGGRRCGAVVLVGWQCAPCATLDRCPLERHTAQQSKNSDFPHHLCVVVCGPQPGRAGSIKPADGFLCSL